MLGFSNAFSEEFSVSIPFGAYDPSLNTPTEFWYSPPTISIKTNDSIIWSNDDKEGHTVTSGKSSGRFGWMNDDFGTPDGYFDSERFMPGEKWSFTFNKPGVFSYFCKIHPWMEGYIIVENTIPNYPQDGTGQKISKLPVIRFTEDGMIEVDLSWEPKVITTHDAVKFIYQFYNPNTNENLQKFDYDFIILQNGKEIFRDHGKNQIGGDYRNFVFEKSGPITIRIEHIQNTNSLFKESSMIANNAPAINDQRTVEFTTIVHDNPKGITEHHPIIQPAQRLEFQYELALLFVIVPGGMFITALLWLKKKPRIKSSQPI